jgi:hypothetical protein
MVHFYLLCCFTLVLGAPPSNQLRRNNSPEFTRRLKLIVAQTHTPSRSNGLQHPSRHTAPIRRLRFL